MKSKRVAGQIGGMLLAAAMLVTAVLPAAAKNEDGGIPRVEASQTKEENARTQERFSKVQAAQEEEIVLAASETKEETAKKASGAEEASESAEETQKVIRVAFPSQDGMSFVGHSGRVTGYNYDYLEKVSEYTGWKMEYVLYPSADGNEAVGNAITDLTEGKADLLGPLLKNDATEEMFEFPKHSYGTVYTTLCALVSGSIREHNLKNQEKLRVGLWEKAETRNAEVIDYLESEKLSYEIVYFETSDEQKQALADGKVDVISSVSLSPVTNARIVAQFAPRPYYFASTKGNTEIIHLLDETMEKIAQTEPKLQDNLYDTYFRQVDDTFVLTKEQKKVLDGMTELNVLCTQDNAPFASKLDGEPAGMIVSILNAFAQETGIKVNYTFCAGRAEAESMASQGDYDMLIGPQLTSGSCASLGFINSAPIMEAALSYVQSPTAAGGESIALVKGLEEQIDTSGYQKTIICNSAKECIDLVDKGKADLAAGIRSVLEYYIYDTASTLVTSQIPGQSQRICMAVSRECDPVFLATLNNYIYSLSEADLAVYLSRGNLHTNNFSFSVFTRRHPVQSVLFVIVVTALLALVIFLMWSKSVKEQAIMQKKHNEQLQEALQIAQDANASKTTFLSNMSHDIRTPMNAVIGFSTLLSKEPDDSIKVKEYARKITAASNHLLGLINDILDISRIESGKVSLHQSVFSINEMVESINVVVRPMAGAKKQSLHIHLDSMDRELFVGDKVRISQILINLLSNAIKYTQAGGTIEFSIKDLGKTSSAFEKLEFVVKDNGYGMSEEFKNIIFDPFTRAENSVVNKEVGTGLGLAITKNIVDLMGGNIDVQSSLGEGSTFTVDLPLRVPHEEEDEHFWEKHGVTKILLVDDEKEICDGIRENMNDTGVMFDAAYSGKEAVELVKSEYAKGHEYSAVILDWQMPGMNGLDTARQIRQIIPIDTPILFLTSYDWSSIETEALEIDVDGFLAKPFTVLNLKEKLIEVEHFKNAVSEPDVQLDLKGMHFLVAEDNELNAEIMAEILASEGASCDVVENGQLAVEKFTSSPEKTYDAVLMDIMMPILNGYDATRQIRASKHPEAHSIPVIAMTANAFVKDVQDALDAGMNAHIAKPINLETLKNTLGSCIRR